MKKLSVILALKAAGTLGSSPRVIAHATQSIIRTTSIVSRSLLTEGYLRNVSRSDNNSHGFLIERWTTIDNRDIKTENR